jgi:hypothetical protein
MAKKRSTRDEPADVLNGGRLVVIVELLIRLAIVVTNLWR